MEQACLLASLLPLQLFIAVLKKNLLSLTQKTRLSKWLLLSCRLL